MSEAATFLATLSSFGVMRGAVFFSRYRLDRTWLSSCGLAAASYLVALYLCLIYRSTP